MSMANRWLQLWASVPAFFLDKRGRACLSLESLILGNDRSGRVGLWANRGDYEKNILLIGNDKARREVMGPSLRIQQMQMGGAVICIAEGHSVELLDRFCLDARRSGREQDLLVIDLLSPLQSNSYNPLLAGGAETIALAIIAVVDLRESDAYLQVVHQFIYAVVAGFKHLGLAFNFNDVAKLLAYADPVEDLLLACQETHIDPSIAYWLQMLFRILSSSDMTDELANINPHFLRQVLAKVPWQLREFGVDVYGDALNTYLPAVDLYNAMQENKLVFIALPSSSTVRHAQTLLQLIAHDLSVALTQRSVSATSAVVAPAQVFWDLLTLKVPAGLPVFFEMGRSTRSYSVVSLAEQHVRLFAGDKDRWLEQLFFNCGIKVFFQMTMKDCLNWCTQWMLRVKYPLGWQGEVRRRHFYLQLHLMTVTQCVISIFDRPFRSWTIPHTARPASLGSGLDREVVKLCGTPKSYGACQLFGLDQYQFGIAVSQPTQRNHAQELR